MERCGSGTITFSAASGAFGNAVRWYDASTGGNLLTTSTQFTTGILANTTSYFITSFNTGTGCETQTRQQVTAIVQPIPGVPTPANNARCGPGDVTLTGSPGANANTLRWYDAVSGGTLLATALSFNGANLASTTMFWISSFNTTTGCESNSRVAVTATIHPVPHEPSVTNASTCGPGAVNVSAWVSAHGTEVRWYHAATGGTHFLTGNSYQTPPLSASTTYWVSAFNHTTGCESARTTVTATIHPIPGTPAVTGAQRCGPGAVTLTASPGVNGAIVYWYDAASAGNLLFSGSAFGTAPLSATTSYWVSSKNLTTGCESPRVPAQAFVNPVPELPVASSGSRCGPGSVTLTAAPGVHGTLVNWYNSPAGGSPLASTANYTTPSLPASAIFWVSSANAATLCESERVQVAATVHAVPGLATGTPHIRCGSGEVSLSATPGSEGNDIRWYATATGGTALATGVTYTQAVTATTTYFAASFNTATGCEAGSRAPVTATILVQPPAPMASGYFGRYGFGRITLLASEPPPGATWQWMDANGVNIPGANAGSYSLDLHATTVFKVKFIAGNGCESPQVSVTGHVVPMPVITGSGEPYLATGQSITLSVPNIYASYQWKRDGQSIAGATQPGRAVAQAGRYSVATTLPNGVSYTSDEFSVAELSNPPEITPIFIETNPPPVVATHERKNLIRTYTAKRPALTADAFTYTSFNKADVGMATQYLDGIGMPVQTTDRQASPSGKDLVLHQEYDEFGRALRAYLPYSSASPDIDADGYRKNAKAEQYTFYRAGTADVAITGVPFAEKVVEPSPLNRIQMEGSAGESWKIGSGHEKRYDFHALGGQDGPVRLFEVNAANQLVQGGVFYAPRELAVSEFRDENGNAVREYKNRENKTVLQRVKGDAGEWLDTYYVYDTPGNLRFVLPPLLNQRPYPYSQNSIDSLAYQYVFDTRQRQIEKRIPGSGWTYMIYDNLDRLVLTQSPNQRPDNKWSFIKYDIYNRPVLSGEYIDSTPYAALRSAVSAQSGYETKLASNEYSLNGAPPGVSIAAVHVQTFYDDYKLPAPFGASHNYVVESALAGFGTGSPARSRWVRGLVTASLTRNLETGAWLERVIYYDTRERVLQTISRNIRNTLDRTTIAYENSISQPPLRTVTRHSVGGGAAEVSIVMRTVYDDQDRPVTVFHRTAGLAELRLAHHRYNEVGQLVEKNLHSRSGANWLQSVDMAYNIRGHLTSINNAALSGGEASDQFGMELYYESGYRQKQYNGNIAGIRWKTARTGQEQSYGFVYDPLNRLRVAEYTRKHTPTGAWNADNNRFSEIVKRYDPNGNILELERFGLLSGPAAFGQIDNLLYSYAGNQLQKVTDLSAVAAGFADDSTPNGTEADYNFDANGNQVKDDNKQITEIQYNHLNLPRRVTKTTGEYMVYHYDGAGRKLRQAVFNASHVLTRQTDYANEFIYEDNQLRFVNHPEGRVVRVGTRWQYQYFLKDHLGSVRATIAPRTDVYTANFETARNSAFRNYTRVNLDLFDHTDAGTLRTFSQRLTGAANSQVGVSRSLAVNAGDTVQVEVWAKYLGATSGTGNVAGFAAALLGAFGLGPPAAGETGTAASALANYGSLVALGGNRGNPAWPSGWLNVLVFDQAYNLVDLSFQQLDAAFVQPVGSTEKMPHQRLHRQVLITRPGFVYIYVSNEGTVLQDIHFDDMRITHRQVQLIQEDAYYPFGMTHSSYTLPNATANPYKYNGKEEQDELNVGWLDYGARLYDNSIGRWGVVDPLAEVSRRWSPYNFSYNNPLRFIDPDGMKPVDVSGDPPEPPRPGKTKAGGLAAAGGGAPGDDETGRKIRFGDNGKVYVDIYYNTPVNTTGRATAGWSGFSLEDFGVGAGGEETQGDPGRFFTNEGDAYRYMWNSSFDSEGKVQHEVAGFLTSKGVLVLPTEGRRTNGENARNTPRKSYNDYLPLSRKDGNLFVTFNGTKYQVLGQVHTHPNAQPFGRYEVRPDVAVQNFLGVPIYIIRANGFYDLNMQFYGTQQQFFDGTKSLIGGK
jgi:RHS repeat-associated protein